MEDKKTLIEITSLCKNRDKYCNSAMKKISCHFPKEIEQYLQPSDGDVISNPKHIRYCMKSQFILGYTGGWKITEIKPDFMQLGLATTIER
jgi:hypothetical protein